MPYVFDTMKLRRPALRTLIACIATACTSMNASVAELAIAAPTSYDSNYPRIRYSAPAAHNAIARFLSRPAAEASGIVFREPRGYLDDLLAALGISPASQVLVFSRTSLQSTHISASRPRAIYFNRDTYVAWVQGSDELEVLTIDAEKGPVYFTVHNAAGKPLRFQREGIRCLVCHDSSATRPGGIPRVLLLSSPVAGQVNPPLREGLVEVTHAMPIEDRWGGWFVTGSLGAQLHVGNLPLSGLSESPFAALFNRSNLPDLQSHIDMSPYLTGKSDVVALLVLEHQAYVHNLITRARFESSRLATAGDAASWSQLGAEAQQALRPALDRLVTALTFGDERRLAGRIRGGAGFEAAFAASGPRDAEGRSLHDFDLRRTLFRYPLSYVVYSEHFDSLPDSLRDYVYGQVEVRLRENAGGTHDDTTRHAALEILAATKPDYAARHAAKPAPGITMNARRAASGTAQRLDLAGESRRLPAHGW